MAVHKNSHIPGHFSIGPGHKNTQGMSRDAGVAGNTEKIPISLSPEIPDSRFSGGKGVKSTPIGAPGNI